MSKRYKVIRKAKMRKGEVILHFQVTVAGSGGEEVSHSIQWGANGRIANGYCLFHDFVSEHMFPSITPEEIRGIFGSLSLPEPAGWYRPSPWAPFEPVVPADRSAIREVTRKVTEWVAEGMDACQAVEDVRGVREWLWKTAEAEPPDFRWRPVREE